MKHMLRAPIRAEHAENVLFRCLKVYLGPVLSIDYGIFIPKPIEFFDHYSVGRHLGKH